MGESQRRWREKNREKANEASRVAMAEKRERDPEAAREYQRRWREKNRAKVNAYVRKHVAKRRRLVREIKESGACADCGGKFHFSAMDFDHVEGEKVDCVGNMTRDSRPFEAILNEIEKCELVCSNCHRVRTWKRKRGEL